MCVTTVILAAGACGANSRLRRPRRGDATSCESRVCRRGFRPQRRVWGWSRECGARELGGRLDGVDVVVGDGGVIAAKAMHMYAIDTVTVSNAAAIHLYVDVLGYDKKDVEKKYYADGEDAHDMRKTFARLAEELEKNPDADVDSTLLRELKLLSVVG